MNDEIRILIDSLRRGQYEDPEEKISLLSAALREANADVAFLLSLLRAPQIPIRLAAIDACRQRTEPQLMEQLVQFLDDPEERVRLKLAETLGSLSGESVREVLRKLMQDSDDEVRAMAVKSSASRPDLVEAQETCLTGDSSWSVRLAAAGAIGEQKDPRTVRPLFKTLANDDDSDVQRRCAEILERRLESNGAVIEKHLPSEIGLLSKAERSLKALGGQRFPKLVSWITSRTNVTVDPQQLAKYGTDLTALAEQGTLPRAYGVDSECETVLKLLRREPWRSVALLGATGTGKSALVNELIYQLAKPENGKWRVLRISPTDFMAGTRYLGEWETKVRELIDTVKKPRRVIIYVPNLSDLSAAGTWSRSESSVATALAPYLEDGSLLLLGESAVEEFERGLGRSASLQRLFDRVLVNEMSMEGSRNVLAAIRDKERIPLEDGVVDKLLEVSSQFLSHISRPGNAVTLLRAVQESTRNSGRPITFREVLTALSKSTGIPTDLLDDAISLNQVAVRDFFQNRIMGQPEAVEAMVDLVTLIKAGLTDPQKPFGTFLFVGPTGVGKTELARTLAEFIFGDASRLKRFDMSEFAGADGFIKLIGGSHENGQLTDAVRHHPFSVVLLDEIEKSHPNVFDLCLQLFDAGRLTDGRGRMVDFRRAIIILTSNIGAAAPALPLGFKDSGDGSVPNIDKERTFRELARFFRPEFLNRIDRIVQFRPLSLEIAERIARREIDVVLQRSGIRRRGLTVEVSPAVVSLVVREGYSPHFGARPLKRTVEQLLLLPLARAISSGNVLDEAVLHLNTRENRVAIATTHRESAVVAAAQSTPQSDESLEAVLVGLQLRISDKEVKVNLLADRKSELLQRTQEPGFYDEASKRAATFDEIHKLDQFLAAWKSLGKAVEVLSAKTQRSARMRDDSALRQKVEQLSIELEHLCFVAESRNADELSDALVCVSLVDLTGASQSGVQRLVGMYQALARRRKITSEILGEYLEGKNDCAYLHVSGLGSYLLLKDESGLHRLDRKFKVKAPRNARELVGHDKELVRVEVMPILAEPDNGFKKLVKANVNPLKPLRDRLLKCDTMVTLFHEPTLRSLSLWTNGARPAALEKALLVLHVQIASATPPNAVRSDAVIRQYELGLSPRIKDARTGRSTTNIDRVLNGHLESLRGF
jgi:ATP-dependent Clp protease ATP-binding subunit ClpC